MRLEISAGADPEFILSREARLLRDESVAMGRSDDRHHLHAACEILLRAQQDADVPAIGYLLPREPPNANRLRQQLRIRWFRHR